MSTDQVLLGVGLIVVLAVGSQVVASLLRIPALILLLPAGFIAGALTSDVNPAQLLGPAYQPLVSVAVALILYDSGLSLEWGKVTGRSRRVVPRLVGIGVPITMVVAAFAAGPLLGMSWGAALMTGAILVVSGPTVVGPLLAFVRPVDRLRRILAWEGSSIDPIGGILGAIVFHAVLASDGHGVRESVGRLGLALVVAIAGAAVGVGVLWVCLCKLELEDALRTISQLGCVVGVAAVCDAFVDDAGLAAAIIMGVTVANLPMFDPSSQRRLAEPLDKLIIGILFVSISATVTPESLRGVILPGLALVAVLVVLTRPLVAFLATVRAGLSRGERQFIGWMAPRGIVAAATASAFGPALAAQQVDGAEKILPVTFLVIVATVAIYGLTAAPVAQWLGVVQSNAGRPLLIGGDPWVIDLARTLRGAGLDVVLWSGSEDKRAEISQAGLELASDELMASMTVEGVELEDITAVLLLTDDDGFNALAALMLNRHPETAVYRLAPPNDGHAFVAASADDETLFGPALTGPALFARYAAGARITTTPADGDAGSTADLLFTITPDGTLRPTTSDHELVPRPDDTLVVLTDNGAAAPG
jgi:NhaP-type Na+/H+ or K+/H+ antiporter